MKAVISDTSPLSYLLLIGEIEILPELFGAVIVPSCVLKELQHPKAPPEVRQWAQRPPEWLRESSPLYLLTDLDLDPGETEAISLAKEHAGSLLIIDEVKGRAAAALHGILITGTLGILEEASRRNLLDFEDVVKKLTATNFRASKSILAAALARVRKSKP